MAVQQGRSERRGESYSAPYVEPLSDATCLREALRRRQETPLADFFSILLKLPNYHWIAQSPKPKSYSFASGFRTGFTPR